VFAGLSALAFRSQVVKCLTPKAKTRENNMNEEVISMSNDSDIRYKIQLTQFLNLNLPHGLPLDKTRL